MLKAYKYRIYPNNEQKIQIAKTFGCCRFVYNQTLAYRKETYEKEKKSVSKTDCNNFCNRELILFLCGISAYSVSTSTDTKYFPLGTCEIVADFISPINPLCSFAFTVFSFGNFTFPFSKRQIALCHEKITNTRKDYLHKVSQEIISENQVIVSENLQIKNIPCSIDISVMLCSTNWTYPFPYR